MQSLRERDPQLVVRDLHKRFDRAVVLDGVDLDVFPGEVVLVAGTNGSGKTTLLRCIAGLARYEGSVTLDGRPCASSPEARATVGYLPQAIGLPAWASVGDVLELFGRLRGATEPAAPLPEGFLPPADRLVGELSGGQRQRVAIAIALLGEPRLLLLDEPAANLDADGRAALVEVVGGLRDRGASVVIAAPSPGDLAGLPDRTVHLEEGRVVGTPTLRLAVREETGAEPAEGDADEPRSEVAP